MSPLKSLLPLALAFLSLQTFAQDTPAPAEKSTARPKLVVGIAVDQMRWDYLHRFQSHFGEGGFKRLLREGFSCDNTFIDHLPSATAVGHACVYTGSVPAINGIAGNDWRDQQTGKTVYCVRDDTVQTVGGMSEEDGRMSPRNLLTTTVGDELRMATNHRSKVVGVSLKDRASILPAGHAATAAYWYEDASGGFISSSYYLKELPPWAVAFNEQNVGGELVKDDWQLAREPQMYTQSTADDVPWEGKLDKEAKPVFPHSVAGAYRLKKGVIRYTPFGNTLTLRFALAAVEGHALGQDADTDLLAINFASTDYIGHKYGPNSLEIEDTYVRLDRDMEQLLSFLDAKVGKGSYTIFLTADHGVAHTVGYMQEHRLPAGKFSNVLTPLNEMLKKLTGIEKAALGVDNYTVSFDMPKIEAAGVDFEKVKSATVTFLQRQPGVLFAVDTAKIGEAPVPQPLKQMIIHGYNSQRTGAVQVVPQSGWMSAGPTGTTHGAWNPYDTHIPLLFMGWGIKHGSAARIVHMQDIAPTLSTLLRIQMPSGCIGQPIPEVMAGE